MAKRPELNGQVSTSDLTRLLTLEAQLDADVTAARAEAARTLEEATNTATQRAATLDAELAAAVRSLDTSIAAERDTRTATLLAEGTARAASLDQLDTARFTKVVDAALTAVVQGWSQ